MPARVEERGGALLVTPEGARLDAAAATAFRAEVGDRAQGRAVVVLDLSAVTFVDSSGLAALISVLKRLAPGGALRLAAPGEAVRSLLKITRLEKIFPAFPDVEKALQGG